MTSKKERGWARESEEPLDAAEPTAELELVDQLLKHERVEEQLAKRVLEWVVEPR